MGRDSDTIFYNIRTRVRTPSGTHIKDPVVHVRVRWIMETRTDPACTSLTEGYMYSLCTVDLNGREVSTDLHTK